MTDQSTQNTPLKPAKNATLILSIDPGATAAFTLLESYKAGEVPKLITTFEVNARRNKAPLIDMGIKLGERKFWGLLDVVAIEKVHSMPNDSKQNVFKFGFATGMIYGFLAAVRPTIPVVELVPSVWKKSLGLSPNKDDSLLLARKLWGMEPHFSLKKDHNKAESALMGAFVAGWRP